MFSSVIKFGSKIVTGAIAKWRIYALVSALIVGAYTAYKIKINGLENKNKNLSSDLILIEHELELVKLSNESFLLTHNELIKRNQECVLNNQANQFATNNALTELENSKNEIDKKYQKLKSETFVSVCGNAIIDSSLIELFQ